MSVHMHECVCVCGGGLCGVVLLAPSFSLTFPPSV